MNLKKLTKIRTLIGLIVAIGAAALFFDVVTDDKPAPGVDHYERIDAYVQDQLDDSRIPGASIAIVENGDVSHVRGFGDDGRGNEIAAETPFWIGSLTKSFTALAVMQLVEAGDVDLDVPVQRYLPDFRVADAQASPQITVRHLLNQTSGFSRIDGVKMVAEARDQTLADAVSDLSDVSLNRAVGESYQYSNLNYVVLGYLVETVSGERWQGYVQAHILDPLGMTHTYTDLEAAEAKGLTATYRFAFGLPWETNGEYIEGLAPTGYLYSTAGDMARYLTMYLQGGELEGVRVLSDAGIAEMLKPNTNVANIQLQSQAFDAQYGEGWFIGPFGAADDARWHQGSLPYFTAWMVLLPESNQAVVVLLNAGSQFEIAGVNGVFSRIPQGIVNVLRGETPPTGVSITQFFIVFNTVVAVVLAVQVWSLVRVARRIGHAPDRSRPTIRTVGPLTWELGVSTLLLVAFPGIIGLGWRETLFFVPDLSLVVLAVSLLWLATGIARVVRLLQARLEAHKQAHDYAPGQDVSQQAYS